jgi:hypothetical protein
MDGLQSAHDGHTSRISVPTYPIISNAAGFSLQPDFEQEGEMSDTKSQVEEMLQYQAEEQLWQQCQHIVLHQQHQRPEQSEVLMCEVWLPLYVIQQSICTHDTLPCSKFPLSRFSDVLDTAYAWSNADDAIQALELNSKSLRCFRPTSWRELFEAVHSSLSPSSSHV